MQYIWLAALCVGILFVLVIPADLLWQEWKHRHAEKIAREWAEKHGTRRSG